MLGDKERALASHAAQLSAEGCNRGFAGQGPVWVHAVQSIQCRIGQKDHLVWPAELLEGQNASPM